MAGDEKLAAAVAKRKAERERIAAAKKRTAHKRQEKKDNRKKTIRKKAQRKVEKKQEYLENHIFYIERDMATGMFKVKNGISGVVPIPLRGLFTDVKTIENLAKQYGNPIYRPNLQ